MKDSKIITLSELSNHLPVIHQKQKNVEFTFKPWRMAEEVKAGEIKAKFKNIGVFTRSLMDEMLATFAGKPWGSYSADERKVMLNQMSVPNMLYMYVYLRYEVLGDEIKFTQPQCGKCGHKNPDFVGDLNTLEVKVPAEDEKTESTYTLKKPFQMGDIVVKGIILGFTPWSTMEGKSSQNEGSLKQEMLKQSILGVIHEDGELRTVDKSKVFAGLTKRDIEGLYDAVDEHNGGPIMGIDGVCESCGHEWKSPILWVYDHFFSNSSL